MAKGLKGVIKDQTSGTVPALRPVKKPKPKPKSKAKLKYVETKQGLRPIRTNKSQAGIQRQYDAEQRRARQARIDRQGLRRIEAAQRKQRRAANQLVKLALGDKRLATKAEQARSVKGAPGVLKPKLTHSYTKKEKSDRKKAYIKALEPSPAQKIGKAVAGTAKKLLVKGATEFARQSGDAALATDNATLATRGVAKLKPKSKAEKRKAPLTAKKRKPIIKHRLTDAETVAAIKATGKAADKLNKPFDATGVATQYALQGKNPAKGAAEGWSQKKRANWKNIVGKTLGAEKIPVVGGATTAIVGTTGNLVMDPLNLPSGGTAAIGKKALLTVMKDVTKAAAKKAAKESSEKAAKRAGEDALRAVRESKPPHSKKAEKAEKLSRKEKNIKKSSEIRERRRTPEERKRRAARRAYKEADEALNRREGIETLTGEKLAPRKKKGRPETRLTSHQVGKDAKDAFRATAPERMAKTAERVRENGIITGKGKKRVRIMGEGEIKGISRKMRRAGASEDEIAEFVREKMALLEPAIAKAVKREARAELKAPKLKVQPKVRKLPNEGAPTNAALTYRTVNIRTLRAPRPTLKPEGVRTPIPGVRVKMSRFDEPIKAPAMPLLKKGERGLEKKGEIRGRAIYGPKMRPSATELLAAKSAMKRQGKNMARGADDLRRGTGKAASIQRLVEGTASELHGGVSHTAAPRGSTRERFEQAKLGGSELHGAERESERIARELKRIKRLANRSEEYGVKGRFTGKIGRKKMTSETGSKLTDDYERGVDNDVTLAIEKLVNSVGNKKELDGIEEMLRPGALELRKVSKRIGKSVERTVSKQTGKVKAAAKDVKLKGKEAERPTGQREREVKRHDKAEERHENFAGLRSEAKGEKDRLAQNRKVIRPVEVSSTHAAQRAQGELDRTRRYVKSQEDKAAGAKATQTGGARLKGAESAAGKARSTESLTGRNLKARKSERQDIRQTRSYEDESASVTAATSKKGAETGTRPKGNPKLQEKIDRASDLSRAEAKPLTPPEKLSPEEIKEIRREIVRVRDKRFEIRHNYIKAQGETATESAHGKVHKKFTDSKQGKGIKEASEYTRLGQEEDRLISRLMHSDPNTPLAPPELRTVDDLGEGARTMPSSELARKDLERELKLTGSELTQNANKLEELHAKDEWTPDEALDAKALHDKVVNLIGRARVLDEVLADPKFLDEAPAKPRLVLKEKDVPYTGRSSKEIEKDQAKIDEQYLAYKKNLENAHKKYGKKLPPRSQQYYDRQLKRIEEAEEAWRNELIAAKKAEAIPRSEKEARLAKKNEQVARAEAAAEKASKRRRAAEQEAKALRKEFDRVEEIIQRYLARADRKRAEIPEKQAAVTAAADRRKNVTFERKEMDKGIRAADRESKRLQVKIAREQERMNASARRIRELDRRLATLERQQQRARGRAAVNEQAAADLEELVRKNTFEVRPDEQWAEGGKIFRGPIAYAKRMQHASKQLLASVEAKRELVEETLKGAKKGTPAFALKRDLEKTLDEHAKLAEDITKYADDLEKQIGKESQRYFYRMKTEDVKAETGWNPKREEFQTRIDKDSGMRLEQTRVDKKTARGERAPTSEVNKERIAKGDDPYDTTDPFKTMRLGLQRDVRRIALQRYFSRWFYSGRSYHGQPLAHDEVLLKRIPGEGMEKVKNLKKAKGLLKNGEELRILTRAELDKMENALRSQGIDASKSKGWQTYYNARSVMTLAWVTAWPGSNVRNLLGDTFNQILGGTGISGILGGWRAVGEYTLRNLAESRVIPYSQERLAAAPVRHRFGQKVAKSIARPRDRKIKTVHLKKDGSKFSKRELQVLDAGARAENKLLSNRERDAAKQELEDIRSSRAELKEFRAERSRGTTKRIDNRRKIGVKDREGRTVYRTRAQLLREAQEHAVTGGFIGGELAGTFGRHGLIPRAAAIREMGPRAGSFIEHRRSLPLDQAVRRTNKYHFDYQDLTRAEKTLRDTFFPFFTWTARNLRLQFGEVLRHPGAYHSLKRVMDMQAQEAGFPDAYSALKGMDPKDVVQLPIQLTKDWAMSMALPAGVLLDILGGEGEDGKFNLDLAHIPKNLLEMGVGLLNPILKQPVEQAANKNFFFDQPLKKTWDNVGDGPEINKPMAPTGITIFGTKITPGVQDLAERFPQLAKALGAERTPRGWIWAGRWQHLVRGLGPEAQFLLNASIPDQPNANLTKDQKARNSLLGVRMINTGEVADLKRKRRLLKKRIRRLSAENYNQKTGAEGEALTREAARKTQRRKDQIKSLNQELDAINTRLDYDKRETPTQQINKEIAKETAFPNPLVEMRGELQRAEKEMFDASGKHNVQLLNRIDELTRQINSGGGSRPKLRSMTPARRGYKTKRTEKPAKTKVSSAGKASVRRMPIAATPPAVVSPAPVSYSRQASASGSTDSATSTGYDYKVKRKNTYTSSVFGGPKDPGTGHIGYRGDDLNKKWDSFAELNMGKAMGNLPYGARVRVTNPRNGKSLILYKRDIGGGGAGLKGKVRGIDIWHKAASKLGLGDLQNVRVEILGERVKIKNTLTGGEPVAAQLKNTAALKTAFNDVLTRGYVNADNLANALLQSKADSIGSDLQTAKAASIPSDYARYIKRADKIASRNSPYLWGGGHVGSAAALRRYTGPLDCSGAVSKVLGIDPRVSGQFTSWGKAGARKDRVTVYANAEHVLMYIPGRGFFGTSKANPGGGANWIPRSAVPKSYLARFTARHI